MNGDVRKDASTSQFYFIMISLYMSAIMDVFIVHFDLSGSCLQSGPIQRTIYVRPPREIDTVRGLLSNLTKLPNVITESGRQWAMVF